MRRAVLVLLLLLALPLPARADFTDLFSSGTMSTAYSSSVSGTAAITQSGNGTVTVQAPTAATVATWTLATAITKTTARYKIDIKQGAAVEQGVFLTVYQNATIPSGTFAFDNDHLAIYSQFYQGKLSTNYSTAAHGDVNLFTNVSYTRDTYYRAHLETTPTAWRVLVTSIDEATTYLYTAWTAWSGTLDTGAPYWLVIAGKPVTAGGTSINFTVNRFELTNAREHVVVFAGDSITKATAPAGTAPGFATLATRMPGIIAYNEGMDGSHTGHDAGGLYGWGDWIFSKILVHQPDLAVIMLGTNDQSPGVGISPAQFNTNIQSMVSAMTASSVKTILATCPPIRDASANAGNSYNYGYTDSGSASYASAMRDAASASGAALFDTYTLMDPHKTDATYFCSADGVHPSATPAHVLIYQNIQAWLRAEGRPTVGTVVYRDNVHGWDTDVANVFTNNTYGRGSLGVTNVFR